MNTKAVYRIIDVNLNRAKEGLRVCEEITRFILNHQGLTADLKKIRHKIGDIAKDIYVLDLIKERAVLGDVGRDICVNELKRKDFRDIFFANIQRVKESIRVLEEFAKLKNKDFAVRFKKIRYAVYEVEKKAAGKISALCDSG